MAQSLGLRVRKMQQSDPGSQKSSLSEYDLQTRREDTEGDLARIGKEVLAWGQALSRSIRARLRLNTWNLGMCVRGDCIIWRCIAG